LRGRPLTVFVRPQLFLFFCSRVGKLRPSNAPSHYNRVTAKTYARTLLYIVRQFSGTPVAVRPPSYEHTCTRSAGGYAYDISNVVKTYTATAGPVNCGTRFWNSSFQHTSPGRGRGKTITVISLTTHIIFPTPPLQRVWPLENCTCLF
jgi:hypothetical protein